MDDPSIKMLVVSETHWDREWYLPFQEFRFKLVKTIDKALQLVENDLEFVNFTLDGQAIVLEDYMEVRPANKDRLVKAISSGRISTGPFYILPDEFLISPEAHVRNLLLGKKVASSFGGCSSAGYMPDSFGHLAQIPAILNGFNIDSFLFTRGMGTEVDRLGSEFEWAGQDGRSKVLAINLPLGYGNVAGITRDKPDFTHAVNTVLRVREKLLQRARTNVLLLMNGVDHLAPEEKLPAFIAHFNKEHAATAGTITHVTLDAYVKALEAEITRAGVRLERYAGDFRNGKEHLLLSDVFSSRGYLLQQNVACQALLERWAEPFSAVAAAIASDTFHYPDDYIWMAWRELLKNHPHDSICGCSVDEVHRDMEYRFRQVRQAGSVLARDAIRHLVPRVNLHPGKGEPAPSREVFQVLVFNPSPFPRAGVVPVWIEMQDFGEPACPEAFELFDASGSQVQLVQVPDDAVPVPPGKHKAGSKHYRLEFLATGVPALGFLTYHLVPTEDWDGDDDATGWARFDGTARLDTDACSIAVNPNGTFKVHDKATGTEHDEWFLLLDEPDHGDEYDFDPLPGQQPSFTSRSTRARVAGARITGISASITVDTGIEVPAGLKADRSGCLDGRVFIPARVTATIVKGKPGIRFTATIDNTARDHRLRVAFPASVATTTKKIGQHFTVLDKPIDLPVVTGWVQAPSATDHFLDFFGVAGKGPSGEPAGMLLATVDSQEQEVRREGRGTTLIATLIRAVGWLGRPGRGAGPDVRTPDAQCQGTHAFDITLLPFTPVIAGDGVADLPADAWRAIEEQRVPMQAVVLRTFDDWHNTAPLPAILDYRRFDQPGITLVDENNAAFLDKPKILDPATSFINMEPPCVSLTACKRAEDGSGVILRACNLGRATVDVSVEVHPALGIKRANEVKLDEVTPVDHHDVTFDGRRVLARAVGHDEILTVKLSP